MANPAQPGPQLGPQPDFGRLSQSFQQVAIEVANFANLPPIARSNEIMEQIRLMRQEMQQNHQGMRQQIQQLRTDITTGHQVTEYNAIARLQNSGIARSDAPLTALRDFTTNADVQGFPATPAHLSNMQAPALDRVLTALSLPTNGTTAEKKQRLRHYAGITDTR